MPTADVQVLVTGTAAAPATFTIPGNGQLQPKAIFASYDGSGAGGNFLPALKIISDGGELVGIYPTDTQVVAGASADVSWFPRLAGAGGGGGGGATLKDKAAIYGDNGSITLVAGVPKNIGWQLAAGDALLDLTTPTAPAIITSGLYCFAVAFGGSGFPAGAALIGELTLLGTTSLGVGTAFPRGTNTADHWGYTGMTRYLAAGATVHLTLTNEDTVNHVGFIHQAFVSLLAT
jgi:hypothetical protein